MCRIVMLFVVVALALTACADERAGEAIGTRVLALVNGSACTFGSQCDSGVCEDGICCAVACGLCSSCDATGSACSVVPADDVACGVVDCSGLDDLPCRDYANITADRCEGPGDCKDPNSSDCSVFVDAPATTDCGVCSRCDGAGSCSTYDASQDADCGTCNECSDLGTCAPQAAGSDCGLCAECDGSGSCSQPAADDVACGVVDCSGLDSSCRNYDDLPAGRCEGLGDCKDPNSADCDVYTDFAVGTLCDPDPSTELFYDGFESGTSSWVVLGTWGTSSTAYAGSASFTDSPTGNSPFSTTWVTLAQPLSFVGAASPKLSFWHRHDLGTFPATVEVSTNGSTFYDIATFSDPFESPLPWENAVLSLAAYAGQPTVWIRFAVYYNFYDPWPGDGWYIDEVRITSNSTPCAACDGSGACTATPVDDPECGSVECDGLDTGCRDFIDVVGGRCEGFGDCKDSNDAQDCNVFQDAVAGTWCAICGACDGAGDCTLVPPDDPYCGTVACGGLDTACRNYDDLETNRCKDLYTCKEPSSADCTDYTDAPSGTVCNPCMECDGAGACNQQSAPGSFCGLCAQCDAAGSCSVPAADDAACGTVDCDGLDSACRDYQDLEAGRCEGIGDCKDGNTTDCNAFTPWAAGTACGAEPYSEDFENGAPWWFLTTGYSIACSAGNCVLRSSMGGSNNATETAVLGLPVSLAGAVSPTLTFAATYSVAVGNSIFVEAGVNPLTTVHTFSGQGSGTLVIPLDPWIDQAVTVRFRIVTYSYIGLGAQLQVDNVVIDAGRPSVCAACDSAGSCSVALPDDDACAVDCDGRDTTCRIFDDLGADRCEGLDDCKDSNSADCNVFTDVAAGADCGRCAACDGGGACVADLAQDQDCPTCGECTGLFTCGMQPPGSDVKDECAATLCGIGSCDGSGACGVLPTGTACGTCAVCDAAGGCTVVPADDDACGSIACGALDTACRSYPAIVANRCEGLGDCKDPNSSDCTFVPAPAGADCGICAACDSSGACAADLTQDADCSACHECLSPGTCITVAAGTDPKNDCDAVACRTGTCNGAGQCGELSPATPCDDGNLCTGQGSCSTGGTCAPGAPVVCAPLDACHRAGTCDPATGLCSTPAEPDGTPCDDADACTTGESCQTGVCGGPTSIVVCSALDQCHVPGVCQAGLCSNPPAADGTPCDDADLCTSGETCIGGSCGGATNVVACTALDECHGPGVCAPGTGQCSTPLLPDGTLCSSGLCVLGQCFSLGLGDASPADASPADAADAEAAFEAGTESGAGGVGAGGRDAASGGGGDAPSADAASAAGTGGIADAGSRGRDGSSGGAPSGGQGGVQGRSDAATVGTARDGSPDAADANASQDDGGCGCRTTGRTSRNEGLWALVVFAFLTRLGGAARRRVRAGRSA